MQREEGKEHVEEQHGASLTGNLMLLAARTHSSLYMPISIQ